MIERKYTDEEIVKALECFSVGVGCKGCPFIDQGCFDCGNIPTEFSESVLALINRQKAEIAVLTTAVDNSTKEFLKLHDEYQDQNAEIEKLQEVNADLNESLRLAAEANKDLMAEIERLRENVLEVTAILGEIELRNAQIKAEAIKAFAERLKETPIKLGLPLLGLLTKSEIEGYFNRTLLQVRDAIDNLVAEMTEGE